MRQHIIVGLDVGTTKICAVAAAEHPGGLDLIGMGVTHSVGLRKGMVINIDDTVDSIRRALAETEACTGVRIKSVSVGISGGHIKGFSSQGAVGIKGSEVTPSDIERAIEAARTVYIPLDREILHVIPTEFILDGQEGITNPVGMSGVRLEARVHIITGAVSSIQNLLKCCEKAGLDVVDIVFEPLASARATLTRLEKESGVVLVDIGGGTTDIALFKDGSLRHASVLGIGGNHITNDIAVGLRVTMPDAEILKKLSGAVAGQAADLPADIQITQSGGQVKTIPSECLVQIIQPRCEEVLEMVRGELKRCCGYEHAIYGVVMTGGSSLLKGFDKLAESTLDLPVRVGLPDMMNGLEPIIKNPQYSTGVGLVASYPEHDRTKTVHAEDVNSMLGKMKHWARDIFRHAETTDINHKKEGGTVCSRSKK
ncbi:MAG: cell division protein FtsA [Nitrospirae bacterium]|nr:MAG: cell division protein FtsA [Nitrospirota bacterium]